VNDSLGSWANDRAREGLSKPSAEEEIEVTDGYRSCMSAASW